MLDGLGRELKVLMGIVSLLVVVFVDVDVVVVPLVNVEKIFFVALMLLLLFVG